MNPCSLCVYAWPVTAHKAMECRRYAPHPSVGNANRSTCVWPVTDGNGCGEWHPMPPEAASQDEDGTNVAQPTKTKKPKLTGWAAVVAKLKSMGNEEAEQIVDLLEESGENASDWLVAASSDGDTWTASSMNDHIKLNREE